MPIRKRKETNNWNYLRYSVTFENSWNTNSILKQLGLTREYVDTAHANTTGGKVNKGASKN